jgi:hypothetical protein
MFLIQSLFICSLLFCTLIDANATPYYHQNTIAHQAKDVKKAHNNFNFTIESTEFDIASQKNDLINFFLRPITFTPDGLASYFENVYNHPGYAEHLAYNISHMVQFLEYGEQNNQDAAFAISVIKLFTQKIKAAAFIDATNFIITIPHLTKILQPYAQKKAASFLGEMQSKLKNHMTNIFSKYFSFFQSDADAFMDALAKQIAQQTNHLHTQQHVDVAYLKKDFLRFFEICINKLILPADDMLESWHTINQIADAFYLSMNTECFTGISAYDDLAWSLIHRFCYILNLSYRTISQEMYNKIMQEIQNKELHLLKTEEQEKFILTKRGFLLQTLDRYKHLAHPRAKKTNSLETIMDSLNK